MLSLPKYKYPTLICQETLTLPRENQLRRSHPNDPSISRLKLSQPSFRIDASPIHNPRPNDYRDLRHTSHAEGARFGPECG
jgi:hypothetical protein